MVFVRLGTGRAMSAFEALRLIKMNMSKQSLVDNRESLRVDEGTGGAICTPKALALELATRR